MLAGCALHGPRFRCANGPILTAHSLGRLRSLLDERLALPPTPRGVAGVDDFLSGRSGYVAGKRGHLLHAHDLLHDLAALPARVPPAHRRAHRAPPPGARGRRRAPRRPQPDGSGARRAAALPPRRDDRRRARGRGPGQVREPRRTSGPPRPGDLRLGHRHRRRRHAAARLPGHLPGVRGGRRPAPGPARPPSPLPRRLGRDAPAHRQRLAGDELRRDRSAHRVRRHCRCHAAAVPQAAQDGLGARPHWSAVARERGWPIGVVDATPIGHTIRPAASDYPRETAAAEARRFLDGRPYVARDDVRTLATHRVAER